MASPDERDPVVLHAALELAERERKDLLWALQRVLALHRGNEFSSAPEQGALRSARRIVEECEATNNAALRALMKKLADQLGVALDVIAEDGGQDGG